MSVKKSNKKKTARNVPRNNGGRQKVRIHGDSADYESVLPGVTKKDNGELNYPVRLLNPETGEEREKRLAARKARTLKAFQLTYKNRHRRKAS